MYDLNIQASLAGLSLVASFLIFVSYAGFKELRRHPSTLIFYLSICDFFFALKYFLVSVVPGVVEAVKADGESNWLCMLEAGWSQFFGFASVSWNAIICVNLITSLVSPFTNTLSREKFYHLYVWLFAVVTTVILISTSAQKDSGDGTCWLNGSDERGWFIFIIFLISYQFFAVATLIFAGIRIGNLSKAGDYKIRVLFRMTLYVLVFIIAWMGPIANKIYQLYTVFAEGSEGPNTASVAAFFLSWDSIGASSQGFANAIVWFSNPTLFTLLKKKFKKLTRGPNPQHMRRKHNGMRNRDGSGSSSASSLLPVVRESSPLLMYSDNTDLILNSSINHQLAASGLFSNPQSSVSSLSSHNKRSLLSETYDSMLSINFGRTVPVDASSIMGSRGSLEGADEINRLTLVLRKNILTCTLLGIAKSIKFASEKKGERVNLVSVIGGGGGGDSNTLAGGGGVIGDDEGHIKQKASSNLLVDDDRRHHHHHHHVEDPMFDSSDKDYIRVICNEVKTYDFTAEDVNLDDEGHIKQKASSNLLVDDDRRHHHHHHHVEDPMFDSSDKDYIRVICNEVKTYDFTAEDVNLDDASGTVGTIELFTSNSFTFHDIAPKAFSRIRQWSGLPESQYISALNPKTFLRGMSNANFTQGRSGSFFIFSPDQRFILKTISKSESDQLTTVLADYFTHISIYKEKSLLTRYYGSYVLTMPHNVGSTYVVIMQNVFYVSDQDKKLSKKSSSTNTNPNPFSIHQIYDLKGSWIDRGGNNDSLVQNEDSDEEAVIDVTNLLKEDKNRTKPSSTSSTSSSSTKKKSGVVLKDNDLTHQIKLNPSIKKQLLQQLSLDSKFLEKVDLMDYSFLVGIHYVDEDSEKFYNQLSNGNTFLILEEDEDDDEYDEEQAPVMIRNSKGILRPSTAKSSSYSHFSAVPLSLKSDGTVSEINSGDISKTEDSMLPGEGGITDSDDSNNTKNETTTTKSNKRIKLVSSPKKSTTSPLLYSSSPSSSSTSLSIVPSYNKDKTKKSKKILYFFGIIDFLQKWDFNKKTERFVKIFFKCMDGDGISALPPTEYRQRFLQSMKRHFA
eukprot:TRINITY_DN3100_c2_g1_i1.p1 TRINITY_DN3100_c2_g1~~TRINITY_DN3100_c2_g1_i1.p1  ORF type:complete len:1070 (-),score=279.74 TRINITY_DN3100_c2_g1_i1:466-3675(-)